MTSSSARYAHVSASGARIVGRSFASGWARLAAQICQAPIGFLAVILDDDWRAEGADRGSGAERPLSLVQRAIAEAAALHVSLRGRPLLLADIRDLWTGAVSSRRPAVRSLAAVPVHSVDRIGPAAVIGVMDTGSRVWSEIYAERLGSLATAITLPSTHFSDFLADSR